MEYRNIRIKERQLVQELFASYYDSNVYCIENRYFDWLHLNNLQRLDCAESDELNVLAAIDGDRLLACISYLPGEVYFDGQKHSAAFTTESLARPEARGAYGLLARRLIGRFDYSFMMGATPFLRDLYVEQMGAHYCHGMSRLVLIGQVELLLRLLERNVEAIPIALEPLERWADHTRRLAGGGSWQRIETAAELRDTYWQSILASGIPSSRRDPAWLEWRYIKHPYIDYFLIAAEASQCSGIAVIRRETIEDLDCHVLRLLEFLPTAGSHEVLAAAVARFAFDSGCAFLDFFCAHDDCISRLPPAFIRPEDHDRHYIPYLLQPPEWRERRSINLLSIRNRRQRNRLPELIGGKIYMTKGDGAQDIALDRGYRSAHLRND